jgi:hypothetical protein
MPFLRGTSFNDGPVRNAVIDFFDNQFGVLLNETPHDMKVIDLTGTTETLLGVEVEGGGWTGCFWENEKYCLISNIGFPTINIPIRKHKYWMQIYTFYGKTKENPSFDKNIFVRANKDFTQMIVIRPDTIRNPNKVIKTRFQPNNSDELEDWLSFRRQDVETYNLINGVWTLDKSYEIQ